MIRVRRTHISGFRGARYPVTFDLTSSCKSIAIFGENAAGKSTITDAIEWFFRDRVEHLWREDCMEEALRNVHLAATDDAGSVLWWEYRSTAARRPGIEIRLPRSGPYCL